MMDDERQRILRDIIRSGGKLIDEAALALAGEPANGRTALGAARGLLERANNLKRLSEQLEALEKAERGL